jgi:nucleoside-diphosphate-sugar epimerase
MLDKNPNRSASAFISPAAWLSINPLEYYALVRREVKPTSPAPPPLIVLAGRLPAWVVVSLPDRMVRAQRPGWHGQCLVAAATVFACPCLRPSLRRTVGERNMKIALTGATGFLGRYLARHLLDSGHTLRCWHRPSSDRSEIPSDSVEWLPGDLDDAASIERLVVGCDAVVHSALARPGAPGFRTAADSDVLGFARSNIVGSLSLMVAARRADAQRFVFIATCAVHEVILSDRPLDEAHPLWPTSHYGAHKAALEKFVHSFGFGNGWPICSLRPTGIYGLAHPPQKSRWFDLVRDVLAGRPIRSARGGKEVHAADVARAVGLLLTADPPAITGQAFNCYDLYVSEQTVAQIARDLTGSRSEIADLNRGPKNQIAVDKIKSLGMTFGGEPLLRRTVAELVEHAR